MTQIKSKHQGVKYSCDCKATQKNESSTETFQIKTDGVFMDDH